MTHKTIFSLSWLLSPVDTESFTQSYLSKAPFRIGQRDSSYYSDLFSEESLEYALYAGCKTSRSVEQLRSNERSQWVTNYQAAVEAYRKGASLRIDAIQRFSRELSVFCGNLQQDFSCPVNINLYLTPAEKQALSRHYDTHDVFVLQIHGKKRWRLFDSEVAVPLEYLPAIRGEGRRRSRSGRLEKKKDVSAKHTCKLVDEFILESGDLLYLPRGFWHEAEAVAGHVSCHLTVGIQSYTYLDLLTVALAQMATQEPRLREALPFGFVTQKDAHTQVREQLQPILEGLPSLISPEAALAEVAEVFSSNQTPLHAGLLQPFDDRSAVDINSKVRVQDGNACTVSRENDQEIALNWGPITMLLPDTFEPAFRFIAAAAEFSAHQLPGEITDTDRIALVQRLIAEGILTEVDAEANAPGGARVRNWLPIHLVLHPKRSSVTWLDFGNMPLAEPFFAQSVSRRKQDPLHRVRTTSVSALSVTGQSVAPSGFVFHISRCGSTMVANALRTVPGTIVISEAQPIGQVLAATNQELEMDAESDWETRKGDLLQDLIRSLGQVQRGDEKSLIIKFSSWSILQLDFVRRLWPEVPVLVIVRDPLEVMVSCLQQPPGWMRLKQNPLSAKRTFGWSEETIVAMARQEYCARALAMFLRAGGRNAGPLCRVIDYADLNADSIFEIAGFFGLSGIDLQSIRQSLSTYSKDPTGQKKFSGDRERKQSLATDVVRSECSRFALPAYLEIKSQQGVGVEIKISEVNPAGVAPAG